MLSEWERIHICELGFDRFGRLKPGLVTPTAAEGHCHQVRNAAGQELFRDHIAAEDVTGRAARTMLHQEVRRADALSGQVER